MPYISKASNVHGAKIGRFREDSKRLFLFGGSPNSKSKAHYELEAAGAEVKKPDSRHETVSITIPAQDHNLLQEIVKRFGWACVF